jgi:hypothetical protein
MLSLQAALLNSLILDEILDENVSFWCIFGLGISIKICPELL